MLNCRLIALLALTLPSAVPAAAQDFAPHRAVYAVSPLEQGRPGGGALGTYAYELRLTCEGYVVNQRLRLELEGARKAIVSEQQSQLSESRDGRKLRFEHRSITDGKVTSHVKGEASLDDNGRGQSLFSEPEGQSVALPAGTLFPIAIARATVQRAMAGDTGFDAQFFFGEKVKPPFEVNVVIGRVPKRLADLAIPKGGESLIEGRTRIYYRGGFFDAEAKVTGEQATFEMSSLALDNGVELYGTHEEGDGGIEYRVTRLEPLPRPNCK